MVSFPRYALASNGSFLFPDGRRVECPDGTIQAEDDAQQEYLEASAKAGCIYLVTEEVAVKLVTQLTATKSDHK